MSTNSWIIESLGAENIIDAETEAGRRRVNQAFGIDGRTKVSLEQLRFISNGLELHVYSLLEMEDFEKLRSAAAKAFQVGRMVPVEGSPLEVAQGLVRLGCLGVLGDRGMDVRRLLIDQGIPQLPIDDLNWGNRVWAIILKIWLCLFRKKGWDDLDEVQELVGTLRSEQKLHEPSFLSHAEARKDSGPAWELVLAYHLAKAAEILGTYLSQGSADGRYDIREQLEAQFDRGLFAAIRGQLMEREVLTRLLLRTARTFVDNSIWTVTRAVNSRVSGFVNSLVSRDRRNPIFEMLPPQRHTLREQGLLGSGHRSVVVSLPTLSGKTLIAEFRILQALNQFNDERGWVAYLAPTRALVNQLTIRLRRDFAEIGCNVEKVSPALEIDSLEEDMLVEDDHKHQFRILVTTPEKFDLMLRGGWEETIGRPLTLVIVDEAHGLASTTRGLKLELLLATINRECRYAQFLLLTPFVPNATEIAHWLAPDSHASIEFGVDWVPNDRAIVIARAQRGSARGDYHLTFDTQHTTRATITIPEVLSPESNRPLDMSWSEVTNSLGKLAAATAQTLQHRGTVIILVRQPSHSWTVADTLKMEENLREESDEDIVHIRRFLLDEMGPDFPLSSLLKYGIGIHHAGLSDDTRRLVEWLTEKSKLRAVVATTTIAQGVNFPVSGVIFASHQYPFGNDMPPEDFWNIAGRAGRVDQGDLGIIALAANDEVKADQIKEFVKGSVSALNSTLVEMVKKADEERKLLSLEEMSWQPEWSAFLQYLAHTYRQIGNHERFAVEVEQVLRGTLGFQALRKSHRGWADKLVNGVNNYAERLKGKPLKLVDATGFSWESVNATLKRIGREGLGDAAWTPELFGTRRNDLQRMVGVLLQVPELRESLNKVAGGQQPDGDKLARIICDWVQGRTLAEMASEYFAEGVVDDPTKRARAMTDCCRNVFGRLTNTASWGLAALQSLTIGDSIDSFSREEQRIIRNLPARVYYGVNSDEAVSLRLAGVPRMAATGLAQQIGVTATEPIHRVRAKVRAASAEDWKAALGDRGLSYHHVWSIIEGER